MKTFWIQYPKADRRLHNDESRGDEGVQVPGSLLDAVSGILFTTYKSVTEELTIGYKHKIKM